MDRDGLISVVPFAPDLLPAVRGFGERYWSRPRTDAYYDWRYLQSQPFSRMFLALQEGECLGMLFALLKPYRIAGQPARCLEVFDWHCLPGLRGSGVGIRLMRAMMRQPEPVISVGGTADVLATLPRMGWELAGVARRYELPVSADVLSTRVRRRTGLPESVTRGVLRVVSAGYFAPRARRAPRDGRVARVAMPGGEIAALYAQDSGYGMVQEPDTDLLRWVTASSWSGRYGFLAFTAGGRLRGWAMTRTYATEQGLEAAIAEVFAPRPDVALYAWMVSEAAVSLLSARPRRIHARASCPALQEALLANRFRPADPDNPVYVWPEGVAARASALHVTLNHSDGALLPYETESRVVPGPAS